MVALSRQEQKKQTREMLLNSALKVFSSKGLMATNTLDVAKDAGVAHGTLFLHFPTRDDLLTEVIDSFGDEIGFEFAGVAEKTESVRELLLALLRVIEKNECFYTRLVIEGPLLPRDARNAIFLIQTGIALQLERVMKKGIAEGRLRKLPLHLLVNSWIGMLNHYLANRDKFAPEGSVIARHGIELVDYFINLIVREGE